MMRVSRLERRVLISLLLAIGFCVVFASSSYAWEGLLGSQSKVMELGTKSASEDVAVAYNSTSKHWVGLTVASDGSKNQIYSQKITGMSEGVTTPAASGNLNALTTNTSSSYSVSDPTIAFSPETGGFLAAWVASVPSGTTESTPNGTFSWSHVVSTHKEVWGQFLDGDGKAVTGSTPFRMTNTGELYDYVSPVEDTTYLDGEAQSSAVASPALAYANQQFFLTWQATGDDDAGFAVYEDEAGDGSDDDFEASFSDTSDGGSSSCSSRTLIFGAAFSSQGEPIQKSESEGAGDPYPTTDKTGDLGADPDSIDKTELSSSDNAQLQQLVRLELAEFQVSPSGTSESSSGYCGDYDSSSPSVATDGSGFMVAYTHSSSIESTRSGDDRVANEIYAQSIIQSTDGLSRRTSSSSSTTVGTRLSTSYSGSTSYAAWRNYDARSPRIAYDSANGQFGVLWSADVLGDEQFEAYYQRIATNGDELGGSTDFSVSSSGGSLRDVAESLGLAFDAPSGEMIAVWNSDASTNDEYEVYSQRLKVNPDATGPYLDGAADRLSHMGVDADSTYDAGPVAVSSTGLGPNLVIWQGDDTSTGNGINGVFGQAIGTNIASTATTDASTDTVETESDDYYPEDVCVYCDTYWPVDDPATTTYKPTTRTASLGFTVTSVKLKKGVISGKVIATRPSSFKLTIGASKPSTLKKKMKLKLKTMTAKKSYKEYSFKKKLGKNWSRIVSAVKKKKAIRIVFTISGTDSTTGKKIKQLRGIDISTKK